MSELKARTAQEIVRNEKDCDYMDELFGGVKMLPTQVYLKSEADAVIAELEKNLSEIQSQKMQLEDDVALLRRNNAELKKERDWLAKDRAQAYDDLEKRAQLNIKQEESISHQKYKRCLNNAWWCRKSSNAYAWNASNHRGWKIAEYYDKKAELYRKWHKRWLELAQKFKEAK